MINAPDIARTSMIPSPDTVDVAIANPYPGLRPFVEGEQNRFFGRTSETNIVIDRILSNRLTLLFAASGVGKSSLLNAGVVPRLKDASEYNLKVIQHNRWVGDAIQDLRATVLKAFDKDERLPDLPADLPLADLLMIAASFVRAPLVLILDQFEEFFRYRQSQPEFSSFIQSLAEITTDLDVPISVVISMREDFAMELNAFSPALPGTLFENFYRLEPLTKSAAADAIVRPAQAVGFRFATRQTVDGTEESLLSVLLNDLSTRVHGGLYVNPVGVRERGVEPPYLQIVCERLWLLDRGNPDRQFRFESYEKAGRARGILGAYIKEKLSALSRSEKRIASLAFAQLVASRSAKNAATADTLQRALNVNQNTLDGLLVKLEDARILRSRGREAAELATDKSQIWYELYHDVFAEHVDRWNEEYRASQRVRQAVLLAVKIVAAAAVAFVAYDVVTNATSSHLRLDTDPNPARVLELHRGKAGSLDFLHLQKFLMETDYSRSQLDPDWLQTTTPVNQLPTVDRELVRMVRPDQRVDANAATGAIPEALKLADKLLKEPTGNSLPVTMAMAECRTRSAAAALNRALESPELVDDALTVLTTVKHPQYEQIVLRRAADPSNPDRQAKALRAAARYGRTQEVVAALEVGLASENSSVKLAALAGLESLPELPTAVAPKALLHLIERNDVTEDVRANAVRVVGLQHMSNAAPLLATRLKDRESSSTLSDAVTTALSQLGGQASLDALAGALGGSETTKVENILKAINELHGSDDLGPLSTAAARSRIQELDKSNALALATLTRLGVPQMAGKLMSQLEEHEDAYTDDCGQLSAALAMAAQKADLPAIAALRGGCADGNRQRILMDVTMRTGAPFDVWERTVALTNGATVEEYSNAEQLETLGRLANDRSSTVRMHVAGRLRGLLGQGKLTFLKKLAMDPDSGVRQSAVAGLNAAESKEAADALRALLNGPSQEAAAIELAAIGDTAALRLLRAQRNPSPGAIAAAAGQHEAWAIQRLKDMIPVNERDPQKGADVRNEGEISPSMAILTLANAGPQGLDVLRPLLQHPTLALRDDTFDAVARMGGEQAEQVLEAQLTSPSEQQRMRATGALGKMKTLSAAKRLATALKSETSADVMTAMLQGLRQAPQREPAIIEAIEAQLSNPPTQRIALEALEELEAYESVDSIAKLLPSPVGIGSRAARTLAMLGSPGGVDRLLEDKVRARTRYELGDIVRSLARVGSYQAVPIIARRLRDSDQLGFADYGSSQLALPLLRSRIDTLEGNCLLAIAGDVAARKRLVPQLANAFDDNESNDPYRLRARRARQRLDPADEQFGRLGQLIENLVEFGLDHLVVDAAVQRLRDWSRTEALTTMAWGGAWRNITERYVGASQYDTLSDTDKRRLALLRLLSRARTPRVTQFLVGLLEDPNLREAAAAALNARQLDAPLAERVRTTLLARGKKLNVSAWRQLSAFDLQTPMDVRGADGLDATDPANEARWRSSMERAPWPVRSSIALRIAASMPGQAHTPNSLRVLREFLVHPDPAVRRLAAKVAGKAAYHELVVDLVPLLKDPRESVQEAALGALATIGGGEAFLGIARVVADRNALLPLRLKGAAALPRFAANADHRAEAWKVLWEASQLDESTMGLAAYAALSRLADAGPMPANVKQGLAQALSDHHDRYAAWREKRDEHIEETADEGARRAHREALSRLAPPDGLTYELAFTLLKGDPGLVPKFLGDDLHQVRDAAATLLALRGDLRALEAADQQRSESKNHALRAAAYTGIDLRLRSLEVIGTKEDVAGIRSWSRRSHDPVVQERLQWTAEAIESRLKREVP